MCNSESLSLQRPSMKGEIRLALTESEYQVAWLILQRRLNRNRNDHTDPRTGVLVETPAFARDEAAIIYEHNVETYRKMGLIMDDPPMIDDDDGSPITSPC